MATDGPTPPPCNDDIFRDGMTICVVDGRSNAVERWVKLIAKQANARVDWHYFGGRANVLHLGDDVSRERTLQTIIELKSRLDGRVLSMSSQ